MFVLTGWHVTTSEQTRREIEGVRGVLETQVPQFVSRTFGLYFERPVHGLSNETRQRWERWLLGSV